MVSQRKKPNVAVRGPARSSIKLVEVYNGDILYPTGIANNRVANVKNQPLNFKQLTPCV